MDGRTFLESEPQGSSWKGGTAIHPHTSPVTDCAVSLLQSRGVDLKDIARLVKALQAPYDPTLTLKECLRSAEEVCKKREVQYAIITGIVLDQMAEKGSLDEPLQGIVLENNPLYGVDKVLALTIVNVYGSIGFSNFGYLGTEKPGFLARIANSGGQVNTFLDDILAAIVAATCARIAHRAKEKESGNENAAVHDSTPGTVPEG
ncbi:MAG: phosphatidylglycerophosphatase A [Firmicutes bacterium]|nr:phosphatidylglycerophosphatase A [Bacillota bacterium]